MSTNILLTVISALATVIGGLFAVATDSVNKRYAKNRLLSAPDANNDEETFEQKNSRHLKSRMKEVEKAIDIYSRQALINVWTNNLLIAGQYLVGGLLASSFIQQSLSPQLVGILGLVVLAATIIHQRYRPDVKYRTAREKVSLLRSTLRSSEDELVVSTSPNRTRLIKKLSQVLEKVEEDVNWEMEEGTLNNPKLPIDKPSHQPVPLSTPISVSSPDLQIEDAKYGAGDTYIDVTPEIKSQIKDGRLEVLVSDHIKGDPIRGVPKQIVIQYIYNGQNLTKTIKQDDLLVLPQTKSCQDLA